MPETHDDRNLSRRQILLGVGGTGLLAASGQQLLTTSPATKKKTGSGGDGTPEQIHLTWGADPASSVSVSWASPGRAFGAWVQVEPHHHNGLHQHGFPRRIPARERVYTDGINGEKVFTYHALVTGLRPGTAYRYQVSAANDSRRKPFEAGFTTAPAGRSRFRFTSFGDLATPNTEWVLSYGQSAFAVAAVESFSPLFHLLNGDLCYANLNPVSQPEVWRDFGNNNQASAANRPWMPCLGNHEIEFGNGPQGVSSYLTRYSLPDNHVPGFGGRWYSFRVGGALFISLDADDVIYQDGAAFVGGPAPLVPAASTGNPAIAPGTSFYVRGYSGGGQTAWLHRTLAAARADDSIDWIIVQMHQLACSSSVTGNGSDLGIREAWLPLFDRYEVDLVLNGHDHDYERSFPVRGFDPMAGTSAATGAPAETRRPHPVTTVDNGRFDTSTGTVHLCLGTGGTNAPLDEYGVDAANGKRQAKIFTQPNRPIPAGPANTFTRAGADALEDAIWSANTDPSTGYGIGVFDLDPGDHHGGETTITVTYHHAAGADPVNPNTGAAGAPDPDYTPFETFTLVRPRSDRHHRRRLATSVARHAPASRA